MTRMIFTVIMMVTSLVMADVTFPETPVVKRGKTVRVAEDTGDISITLSRKKWSEEKGRFLCCPLAGHHCKHPCNGQSCSATCTLSCGLFSFFSCAPMTCQAANPTGCTSTTSTTCPSGWTTSASTPSKCFKASTADSNWLAALQTCIADGGTLAKPETAAENTEIQTLLGGQVGWIGLQDFLVENTFSWADGAALGSFTNWANTQPDNNGVGQHCVAMTAAGLWNDVICNGARPFVCQRAP